MKRKVLITLTAVAILAAAYLAARPYVSVVADPGFGVALKVRTSKAVKFTPVFVWRFEH